jgi:hypothetical protein
MVRAISVQVALKKRRTARRPSKISEFQPDVVVSDLNVRCGLTLLRRVNTYDDPPRSCS